MALLDPKEVLAKGFDAAALTRLVGQAAPQTG
jgi:hypothetical protein